MKSSNKIIFILALFSITTFAQAHHQKHSTYYAKGKVVEVIPVYEKSYVKDYSDRCNHDHPSQYSSSTYSSSRYSHHDDQAVSTVVGATIGGVVGNRIFKNSRLKNAGTLAGVIVGAAIGNDIRVSHYGRKNYRSHKKCRVVRKPVKTLVGYQVTYRYQGELFSTRTQSHPGRKIAIKVRVEAI